VSNLPKVSVLVLNLNGGQYLDECFSSLEPQIYPRDRFEIVLVDNGSADGSRELIQQKYPRARVLGMDRNRGVAVANNLAVRSSDAEFVALLNGEARVDSQWLAELVAAAGRHDAVAVASKILDWHGETTDFVGAETSFTGHSRQVDSRDAATQTCDEARLLFPCAGSALFSRSAYLDAGGFDEDFFAYGEDVDLGCGSTCLAAMSCSRLPR